jgi:hypothetical protein
MFFKYFLCERHWLILLLRFTFFLSCFYHSVISGCFYSEALVSRMLLLAERTFSAFSLHVNTFHSLTGFHSNKGSWLE